MLRLLDLRMWYIALGWCEANKLLPVEHSPVIALSSISSNSPSLPWCSSHVLLSVGEQYGYFFLLVRSFCTRLETSSFSSHHLLDSPLTWVYGIALLGCAIWPLPLICTYSSHSFSSLRGSLNW